MLLYWAINRPQSVGVGTAFVVGMLTDIGTAAPLGQHALSYMLITFLVQQRQRQIILLQLRLSGRGRAGRFIVQPADLDADPLNV